jgi:hypothetical protein
MARQQTMPKAVSSLQSVRISYISDNEESIAFLPRTEKKGKDSESKEEKGNGEVKES